MTPSPSRPISRGLTLALIGLLCLVWGSTWVVIKGGLDDLPPFSSAGFRFVIAAGIMCAAALFLRRREGGATPPVWLVGLMGVFNFALSYGIVYWSETVLPSGLVSVLWAVFPMMVAGLSHRWLPGERLGASAWTGFLLGFVGVVLLFLTDIRGIGPDAVSAALILLISPTVCAVVNTVVKRHAEQVSSVLLNRNGMLLGAVLLLAFAALTERQASITWTPFAIFSVAYLAIFGTALTFGLYFWLLRTSPAHHLSLIAYVTPAVALFLGWLFRGEPIGAHTLAGTALILGGVWLVLRVKRQGRPVRGPLRGPARGGPGQS